MAKTTELIPLVVTQRHRQLAHTLIEAISNQWLSAENVAETIALYLPDQPEQMRLQIEQLRKMRKQVEQLLTQARKQTLLIPDH